MFRQTPKYATSAFFGLALALIACGDPTGSTSHSANCHDADENKSTATSTATAQQSSATAAPTPPASANPNATTTSAQPAVIDSNAVSGDTLKLQLEEERKNLGYRIQSLENKKASLLVELDRVNQPEFEKNCKSERESRAKKCDSDPFYCPSIPYGSENLAYKPDECEASVATAAFQQSIRINQIKLNQAKKDLQSVEEKLKSLAHTLKLNQD